MPDCWKEYRLGDLGEIITGRTPPSKRPECFGDEYPFITPSDMVGQKRALITDRYLSADGAELLKRNLLPPGSVAVSCIGWQMGKAIMTSRPSFTNQQLNTIIPNGLVYPDFLYYVLVTWRERLLSLGASTGVRTPILNKSAFSDLRIQIPPLPAQRKIAAVLSAYDDLIENNSRRIALLEAMAHLLYREWFVEFRYPGHESVPLVESELGPVPEGWEVGRLDDALMLQRGFDLPRKKRRDGSVPVYASTGIIDTHNKAKVKAPGVVTGRSGSLGTVIYADEDFWPLNTALWVREFRRATPIYAFFLLDSSHLEKYNSGASVPTLNRNDVHGLPVVLPPQNILDQFECYVSPMFELKKSFQERNQTLRQTRDLFLPRLISGELDVARLPLNLEEQNQ